MIEHPFLKKLHKPVLSNSTLVCRDWLVLTVLPKGAHPYSGSQ